MRGFTLPELLITLALLAIVLSQLTPDLSTILQQNRAYSVATEFSRELQLTRNEAIKRNRKVTLCKSSSGDDCNSSDQWESGWIMFENSDGDGKVDAVDIVLRTHGTLPVGITLRGIGNFKNRVTYKPTGDSTSFSRLVICSDNQLEGAQVIYINSTGRIRIADDGDGDGIPEDSSGNNISSCG
ncbi:MAG: GspH/FimT family pseudopilin [Gammaproteobacteria bacterium]|uniref:Type II secretion system protein H n=1 Tax=Candidatus Thiopontia autotrophica TaxID=2841688 RepID=A0A8J6TSQ8_9GAMM|nr:GspH/FimT family pseudopilin [Candidatus Thiopontia autotrophica]